MIYFILGIICIFIGFFIGFIIGKPNRIKIIEQNKNTQNLNIALEQRNSELSKTRDELNTEVSYLQAIKDSLNVQINEEKERAEIISKTFLETQLALVNEKFDRASEEACLKYQDAQQDFEDNYLQSMKDAVNELSAAIKLKQERLIECENALKSAKEKQDAITELLKRQQKEKDKINFYKLQLSEQDIQEIQKLREIIPYLRNFEPLNKVIWKSYYEKPFTDLIGRVVGSNVVCGIYKITNLENKMTYIGQSTNIKERWRTHVKRGVGAETPTRNKLYTIMNKIGVENFSFEIIEECPREQLNEKERYWISYFNSQDFGYNETKGNA